MLDSNLGNITDFTLSKCTYPILTESKFLLLSLSALMCKVHSPAVLHGLPFFFGVNSDFVSAYVCFCITLCSGSSFHIHCTFSYMLGIASMGVSFHNIYSSLALPFPLHTLSAVYFDLVSAYLSFVPFVFLPSGPKIKLAHCFLHWYLLAPSILLFSWLQLPHHSWHW